MTQGKLSVNNKPPNSNGQEDKRDNAVAPSAPPSYEEATSGEGMKAGAYPTPPSVPLHPSWAYVDPSTSPSYGSGGYPGDTEMLTTFSWDDRNVRRVFIRKVICEPCIDPVKDYIQTHPAWYWYPPAKALTLGPSLPLPNCLSHTLITGLLLGIWGGWVLCNFCSYYDTKSVLLCLGITALVCLSVTIFSFQTKYDFTSCQGVLFVMLMVLVFGGIIMAVILPFQYVPWLHAIYAVLGAILFTMFLAFDMQMLMGNRRYALSPEEYIFGALNIYLDIIYIFSFLLQFFGSSQE
uniref:Protein lifeguard 2 n=1 Tax=Crocodylus porosus TaxID=8502 RepID=A0A7M4FTY9_CROPO